MAMGSECETKNQNYECENDILVAFGRFRIILKLWNLVTRISSVSLSQKFDGCQMANTFCSEMSQV